MTNQEEVLCWECVSDPVLRIWMREQGHAGVCSFCGKRRIACALHDVADRIDTVMREFYRPGEQRGHVVPDSDNPQYWEDGEPATEIIQEIAGVEPEVAEAIDGHLSEAEGRDVQDGGPRWTPQIRPLIDGSKPAISAGRPRPMQFYFASSSVRKSVWTFVRQLRGPHLSTCA